MHLQRLREYIRKLKLRRYLVQAHVAVLDHLMCEVLTDTNVLCDRNRTWVNTLFRDVCGDSSLLLSTVISLPCEASTEA